MFTYQRNQAFLLRIIIPYRKFIIFSLYFIVSTYLMVGGYQELRATRGV